MHLLTSHLLIILTYLRVATGEAMNTLSHTQNCVSQVQSLLDHSHKIILQRMRSYNINI